MYTEQLSEKIKSNIVRLTGSNRGLYYTNEREVEVINEDGTTSTKYEYDVYEVEDASNPRLVKNSVIEQIHPSGTEIKILRKAVANILQIIGKEDAEEFAEFTAYNTESNNICNEVDGVGKVIQTVIGDGTIADPYKSWKVGMAVVKDAWYLTPINGYLWQAIKDGYPVSEVDSEYFDVVGL